MDHGILSQRLHALAKAEDPSEGLVVRAGPGATCFRFARDATDPERRLSWEARSCLPTSEQPLDGDQTAWLTRLGFRRSDDSYVCTVAMPHSLGTARLIAAVCGLLLEKAYCLSAAAPVTIACGDDAAEASPNEFPAARRKT